MQSSSFCGVFGSTHIGSTHVGSTHVRMGPSIGAVALRGLDQFRVCTALDDGGFSAVVHEWLLLKRSW